MTYEVQTLTYLNAWENTWTEDGNDRVVFEVEAFKPLQCAHDWVWPCWPAGDARYGERAQALPQPQGIDFVTLAANAAADTVQKYAVT